MTAVFEKIIEMSLTSAVVIVVVMAIRLLLRKAPRKYAYALWSVVAFRLVCPVSFKAFFSLFRFVRTVEGIQTVQTVTNPVPTVSPGYFDSVPPGYFDSVPSGTGAPVEFDPDYAFTYPITTPPAAEIPWYATIDWVRVAAIVWLIGLATLIIYGIVSYVCLRCRMRTAVLSGENIWYSDRVQSPFILGFVRPRIYLPFGLSEDEQRYVLAHERYHLKRLDHIARPLSFLILAVHWFNPFVWAAYYLMGADMEMSCDEKVLSTEDNIRKAYSTTLLSFAANRRFPSPSPLAFGEGGVKKRIKNALNWKKPRTWVTVIAIIVCIVVIVVCAANPAGHPYDWAGSLTVDAVERAELCLPEGDSQRELTESEIAELVAQLNQVKRGEYGTYPKNSGWAYPTERIVIITCGGMEYVLDLGLEQLTLYCRDESVDWRGETYWHISNDALKAFIRDLEEPSIEINLDTVKEIESITNNANYSELPDVEEPFFEDGSYIYSFGNPISQYVIVKYTDGSSENVKEALEHGHIQITDLDRYNIYYYAEPKLIENIVDLTQSGELSTNDALETFYADDDYYYIFGSMKSHYVIVYYKDGTEQNVKEALAEGKIRITDLDWFGIGYWKELKTSDNNSSEQEPPSGVEFADSCLKLKPELLTCVEEQVALRMGGYDLAYVEQVENIRTPAVGATGGHFIYRVTYKPGDYDDATGVTWQDKQCFYIVTHERSGGTSGVEDVQWYFVATLSEEELQRFNTPDMLKKYSGDLYLAAVVETVNQWRADLNMYYVVDMPLGERDYITVAAVYGKDPAYYYSFSGKVIPAVQDGVRYYVMGVGNSYSWAGNFKSFRTYRVVSKDGYLQSVEEVETFTKNTILRNGKPYTGDLSGTFSCLASRYVQNLFGQDLKSYTLSLRKNGSIDVSATTVGTGPAITYSGSYQYDEKTGTFTAKVTGRYANEGDVTIYPEAEVKGKLYEYGGFVHFICESSGIHILSEKDPLPLTFVPNTDGGKKDDFLANLSSELVTPDTLPSDPEEYYLAAALPESQVYLYAKNSGEDSMLVWNGNLYWTLKGRTAHTPRMNLPELYLLAENAKNTTVAAISEVASGTEVSVEQLVVYVMGEFETNGSYYTGLRQAVYDWSFVHEAFNKKNTLVYDADTNSFALSWSGKTYNSGTLPTDMGQLHGLKDGYTGSLFANGNIMQFAYVGGNRFAVTVKTCLEDYPLQTLGRTGLDLIWTVEFNGEGFDIVGEVGFRSAANQSGNAAAQLPSGWSLNDFTVAGFDKDNLGDFGYRTVLSDDEMKSLPEILGVSEWQQLTDPPEYGLRTCLALSDAAGERFLYVLDGIDGKAVIKLSAPGIGESFVYVASAECITGAKALAAKLKDRAV